MKALPLFALSFFSLLPLSSQAIPLNDDFALEVDLTLASDYRTRGISQTQNDPALQAGATLAHSSGLYLGAWTSNVDFGGGLKTRQEVDYYAGWFWEATDAINLDLGARIWWPSTLDRADLPQKPTPEPEDALR